MLDRPAFRPVRRRGRQPKPALRHAGARDGFATTRPPLGSAAAHRHACRTLVLRHGALA